MLGLPGSILMVLNKLSMIYQTLKLTFKYNVFNFMLSTANHFNLQYVIGGKPNHKYYSHIGFGKWSGLYTEG